MGLVRKLSRYGRIFCISQQKGVMSILMPFWAFHFLTFRPPDFLKNRPYLNNFLTNPIHILLYSGDSDPKSPEYAKKVQHLVRKLSRYGRFYTHQRTRTVLEILNMEGKYSSPINILSIVKAILVHISITFLPTPYIFCYIRVIQTLIRPNMPKYTCTW